jgi:hypothetical protein
MKFRKSRHGQPAIHAPHFIQRSSFITAIVFHPILWRLRELFLHGRIRSVLRVRADSGASSALPALFLVNKGSLAVIELLKRAYVHAFFATLF